jgi:hypothetical protein
MKDWRRGRKIGRPILGTRLSEGKPGSHNLVVRTPGRTLFEVSKSIVRFASAKRTCEEPKALCTSRKRDPCKRVVARPYGFWHVLEFFAGALPPKNPIPGVALYRKSMDWNDVRMKENFMFKR